MYSIPPMMIPIPRPPGWHLSVSVASSAVGFFGGRWPLRAAVSVIWRDSGGGMLFDPEKGSQGVRSPRGLESCRRWMEMRQHLGCMGVTRRDVNAI
eukprot:752258-Hanusia_phi.AAC.4